MATRLPLKICVQVSMLFMICNIFSSFLFIFTIRTINTETSTHFHVHTAKNSSNLSNITFTTPKVAIAVKSGNDVIDERMNFAQSTFLQDIRDYIIISDSPHQEIQGHTVYDVISPLYTNEEEYKHLVNIPIPYKGKNNGWILDTYKNIPSFQLLLKHYPDHDWYLLIDDDTWLFYTSLQQLLTELDASEPIYIGNPMYYQKSLFGHGGSGILLSKSAVQQMEPSVKLCNSLFSDCWAGDVRLSKCLNMSNVPFRPEPYIFNAETPLGSGFFGHPCSSPITYHHLNQSDMNNLMELSSSPTLAQVLDLQIKLNDRNSTFHDYRVLLNSAPTEVSQVESWIECHNKCELTDTCLQWSTHGKECSLYSRIGSIKKSKGHISGFIQNRYQCQE